jgi:hypothetical protein
MQPADHALTSEIVAVIRVRDTLEDWKWKPTIHPDYDEVYADHWAWFSKFMPAITECGLLGIARNMGSGMQDVQFIQRSLAC